MSALVISYSRPDQSEVRAVVALLKAAFPGVKEAVFWDGDFEPGEPWFQQIAQHIDRAPQLFVFWCEHSATSVQVRREFVYALGREKRVVPVLLDDTALPAELAPIHGIDLRDVFRHRAPSLDGKTRPRGGGMGPMMITLPLAWWRARRTRFLLSQRFAPYLSNESAHPQRLP